MLRPLLLALSRSRRLRRFAESSPRGRRLSSRFVAGLTLDDALTAVQGICAAGMSATLDHLGENVHKRNDAIVAAHDAIDSLTAIQQLRLDANISVKLTHFGLDLNEQLALDNLHRVAETAERFARFVRVDMEDSRYVDITLRLVRQLHASGLPIGAVIQSYLRRSANDVRELIDAGIRVRLVKGAYKESANVAYQRKSEVDRNFVELMRLLLDSGIYHAIATHDPRMIDATLNYARQRNIGEDGFEFQMLYGVRRDLQRRLRAAGWRVRIYIPYGQEWYPYFMRRLAERPANLIFLLKNLLRDGA